MLTDTQKIEKIKELYFAQPGSIVDAIQFAHDVGLIIQDAPLTAWKAKAAEVKVWLEAEIIAGGVLPDDGTRPTPTAQDFAMGKGTVQ